MKCPDLPAKTLLRPDEVAEFFSVSVQTIYQWCDSGSLQSVKINGTTRVYRESIIKLLRQSELIQIPPTQNTIKNRRVLSKGVQ